VLIIRRMQVPANQTETYIELHMPDVLLIQMILLKMSTSLLETSSFEINTYGKELCVRLFIYKN